MKLFPFIYLLSVIKGETTDQKDLSREEHFWKIYLKLSGLQQLYSDEYDYLPSRCSRIQEIYFVPCSSYILACGVASSCKERRPVLIYSKGVFVFVFPSISLCNHVTLYGLASPRLLHSLIDHIKTSHSFKHRYSNGR